MVLERLLRDISLEDFLGKHLHLAPYSQPGGASEFASLGTWQTLERTLASREPDVLVVKDGKLTRGGAPKEVEAASAPASIPTYDEARALSDCGHTIVVRNAERNDAGLDRLARAFQDDFRAPINVHLYITPTGAHGFGWHYDVEDVFILQTSGSKEYSVRKNTVNPWPTLETTPPEMMFEREVTPVMKCTLAAGDWLYVPAGYWHRADAGEESLSIAVGVMSPTAIDVFDFLRRRILRSLVWRQRLPITGRASGKSPEEILVAYNELFGALGKDLATLLADEETAREFLSRCEEG